MTRPLPPGDARILLKAARLAIERALKNEPLPDFSLEEFPEDLQAPGACFVTLMSGGALRGCVGSIEAVRPLIEDARDRALAAAFKDPRFPPLKAEELPEVQIEISVLSSPTPLVYGRPQELAEQLTPGRDGLILKSGFRRATFLPQVWEQLPSPELFLGRLCQKMGLDSQAWLAGGLEAETYQVQKISEDDFNSLD